MSYPLGPFNVTDQYVPQFTIETQECARIDFFVQNNPILYQLQQEGSWSSEKYIPGATNNTIFVSLDRIYTGVRVRNAIAGSVAIVTLECIPANEIPDYAG